MSKMVRLEPEQPSKPKQSVILSIAGVCLLLLAGLAIAQYFPVLRDVAAVASYQASPDIAAVQSRLGLTRKGDFYFRASHPELLDRDEFNLKCQRHESSSPVLGCYANGQIYVYSVTNRDLDGIVEVTAAHELLHAAYWRLGSAERQHIDSLLESVYEQNETPELAQRMAYYDRTEPGERLNELHSIIGTEMTNLPDELAAHYQTYFSDRSKIVAFYQQYRSAFESIEAQVAKLGAKLAEQRPSIENDLAALQADISSYNQDKTSLESATIDRSDPAAVQTYNARAYDLNQRRHSLQTRAAAIDDRISSYNQLVTEFNKTSLANNELATSIDSMAPNAR